MPLPDKAIFFSRFNSLNKEIFLNNGFKKEVHIVSKSLAFDVILRTSGIDLRGAQIFVQLFYDADSSAHHKPVDRVKAEPLTSRIFVVEESEKISCDIKINALSSQHEDSLFRLRVLVVEAGGTATQAFSDPIKVVSKPSLAKKSKKRDRPEGSEKLFLSSLEASTSKDLSEKSLFDVLSKMERQQQKIIEHLKGNSSKGKPFLKIKIIFQAYQTKLKKKKVKVLLNQPIDNLLLLYEMKMKDLPKFVN